MLYASVMATAEAITIGSMKSITGCEGMRLVLVGMHLHAAYSLSGLPMLLRINSFVDILCSSCAAYAFVFPAVRRCFALRLRIVGPCVSGIAKTRGHRAMMKNQCTRRTQNLAKAASAISIDA